MCEVCDAKNRLLFTCRDLREAGQADLAIKFEGFVEIVRSRVYEADNPDKNRQKKVKMLDLANSFAQGYMPMSEEVFLSKINSFHLPNDDSFSMREAMKEAMIDLFIIYRNRLPWALYGGYVFMVTRPNIHVAERLPDLKLLLPDDLPWECVDAVWHGFPPATALYMHILSVINRKTGTVPLHGCGCNHYMPPINDPDRVLMKIVYPKPDDIVIETEVPLSHCLNAIETLVQETFVLFGETTKSLQHFVRNSLDSDDPTEASQLQPELGFTL